MPTAQAKTVAAITTLPAKPPKGARPPVINGAPAGQQVPMTWASLGFTTAPQLAAIPDPTRQGPQTGFLLNYARLSYDAAKKDPQLASVAELFAWPIDAMNYAWANSGGGVTAAQLLAFNKQIKAKLAAANAQVLAIKSGKTASPAAPTAPTAAAKTLPKAPVKKPVASKTTAKKPVAKKPVAKKPGQPTSASTKATPEVTSPLGIPDVPTPGTPAESNTGLIVAGVAGAAALGTGAYFLLKKKKK